MEQKTNLKRRNFLRAVGAGGAAAAVVAGGQRVVADAAPDRPLARFDRLASIERRARG